MKAQWTEQQQQQVETLTKEYIAAHLARQDNVAKSPEACLDATTRHFEKMVQKTHYNSTTVALLQQTVNAATSKVLLDHKDRLDELRTDVNGNTEHIARLEQEFKENLSSFAAAVDEHFEHVDSALAYLKQTQDQMRTDLSKLVKAQQAREKAEAHQRQVETSFQNAQAAVGLLAGVLQATNHPELARNVQLVGSCGVQITRGILSIVATGCTPAALLTIGGGIMALVNGFMGGKDANQILQEQIQALAQQMYEMQQHFDLRFDRLETMLGYMHRSILEGFHMVREDISHLATLTRQCHEHQIKELHGELEDIKKLLSQNADKELYALCDRALKYVLRSDQIVEATEKLETNIGRNSLDTIVGADRLLKSDAVLPVRVAALWRLLSSSANATAECSFASPERFISLGRMMVLTTIRGLLKTTLSATEKANLKTALDGFVQAGGDFQQWRKTLLDAAAWETTTKDFYLALDSIQAFVLDSADVGVMLQQEAQAEEMRERVERGKLFDGPIQCRSSLKAWKNVQKTSVEGKVLVIRDYDSHDRMKAERFRMGGIPVRKDGSKKPSVDAVRCYKLGLDGRVASIQNQLQSLWTTWKQDAQTGLVRVAEPRGYDQACLNLNVTLAGHALPLTPEWIAYLDMQDFCDAERSGLGRLTFSHSLSPHGLLTVRVDWQPYQGPLALLRACIIPIDPAVLLPHLQMMRYMNVSGLMQLWQGMPHRGLWDTCSGDYVALRQQAPLVIQSARHFEEYHQLFDALPVSWRHFSAAELDQAPPVIPELSGRKCDVVRRRFVEDARLIEALDRTTHCKVLLETHALLAFPDYLSREGQYLTELLQVLPSGAVDLETLLSAQVRDDLKNAVAALQIVSASLEDAASFVQFDQLVQVLRYLCNAPDVQQLVIDSAARGAKRVAEGAPAARVNLSDVQQLIDSAARGAKRVAEAAPVMQEEEEEGLDQAIIQVNAIELGVPLDMSKHHS
jgi:hypothetical protein